MIEKNRWLMALSAVGVHICIGSVMLGAFM